MIHISPLPALQDNYIWLLQDPASRCCAVVDPGEAKPVEEWLNANPDWTLTDIVVTHHHFDHVDGIQALKKRTSARVSGPGSSTIPALNQPLTDGDRIQLLNITFEVLATPGHTLDHLCYFTESLSPPRLFSGDTLFAAGCGRLFEGTPAQMETSLQRLSQLPADTLVYCTHEYTLSNLRFARAVEPDNENISRRLADAESIRLQHKATLPSTLEQELLTNPFLRCGLANVKRSAEQHAGHTLPSVTDVFSTVHQWKNDFKGWRYHSPGLDPG